MALQFTAFAQLVRSSEKTLRPYMKFEQTQKSLGRIFKLIRKETVRNNMNIAVLKIEEQNFLIQDPQTYFDQNLDNYGAHDAFFNQLTIPWQFFLNQGRFRAAEQLWNLALKIAYDWQSKNQNKRIHKGTPYYFCGVTCILNGDLEKGFFLMHQALEEDKETHKTLTPGGPAFCFVALDYQEQNQFFRPKVEEIAKFVEEKLNIYRSSRVGILTLSDFKSKFLEEPALQEVVFYFVFELFRLKKLLTEIDQRLTQNVFISLLEANTI